MPTSGDSRIDALCYIDSGLVSARWNFPASVGTSVDNPGGIGTSAQITYSFSSSVPNYYAAGDSERLGYAPLTNSQRTGVRTALNLLHECANVTFTEVPGVGEMVFSQSDFTGTSNQNSAAYAYAPTFGWTYSGSTIQSVSESDVGGDVWLDTSSVSNQTDTVGSYGLLTLIHEIGHALGLKHPFESPNVLPTADDNRCRTVMSYTDVANSGTVTVTGDQSSMPIRLTQTPTRYSIL